MVRAMTEERLTLAGLHVIMADDCAGFRADGRCLSREAVVGDERDLRCVECGADRKKLHPRAASFLVEIITKFGWPARPITLRRAIKSYPRARPNPARPAPTTEKEISHHGYAPIQPNVHETG